MGLKYPRKILRSMGIRPCVKCNGSLGWYEQFAAEIVAYLGLEAVRV